MLPDITTDLLATVYRRLYDDLGYNPDYSEQRNHRLFIQRFLKSWRNLAQNDGRTPIQLSELTPFQILGTASTLSDRITQDPIFQQIACCAVSSFYPKNFMFFLESLLVENGESDCFVSPKRAPRLEVDQHSFRIFMTSPKPLAIGKLNIYFEGFFISCPYLILSKWSEKIMTNIYSAELQNMRKINNQY